MAGTLCETASLADIGGRDEQQDRVAVFEKNDAQLLVLADGMGGHEGGALAAEALLDVAHQHFEEATIAHPTELLTRIATGTHERINALGDERGISPHSTCVLLHLTQTTATWAHVGDSRLYRFSNGRLAGRTIDHSVVELMRLRGRITSEQMKTHPDQNRLYLALGGRTPPEVETGNAGTAELDGFLLASDGLWENIADNALEKVFEAEDLATALGHLVELAKVTGGPECDNISVAVARYRSATPSFALRLCRALSLRGKTPD